MDEPLYCSQECRVRYETSIGPRLAALEARARDAEARFDTLQTPWWKRIAFWLDGWPWYDLNGTQAWRPWHGVWPAIQRGIRSIRFD